MSFILLGILNAQAEAGGIVSDYELLETTILDSSASSVSFTGLGSYSDYQHLQIRAVAAQTSTGGDNIDMTVNSDTGANYAYYALGGGASSVFSESSTSRNNMAAVLPIRAGTDAYSAGVLDILDFSDTSKNTTVRSLSGIAGVTGQLITLVSGLYTNTAAITSITLTMRSNDIATGSRFSLYGLKAGA